MIKIQEKDFNVDNEIKNIQSKHNSIGAMTSFVGYVRNVNNNKTVESINIHVYKKMALKSFKEICEKSKEKWSIIDTLIIHRFGNLKVNEKIILVATFSMHRNDSSEACSYIMDFIKKEAPFWKKEFYDDESSWL